MHSKFDDIGVVAAGSGYLVLLRMLTEDHHIRPAHAGRAILHTKHYFTPEGPTKDEFKM